MAVADRPDEDELGFTVPGKPSELRSMPDDELAETYRKSAFANLHPFSAMLEHEMSFRLIAALKDFKSAADRSARTLNVLTVALLLLTAALVFYAIRTS
jgi:hypothetical protein